MKEFKGKVMVITGAASGIGYAIAKRCAQEGILSPSRASRNVASKIGSISILTICCTTRSLMVEIPRGRFFPLALGIYVRRTGSGRYVFVLSSSVIDVANIVCFSLSW